MQCVRLVILVRKEISIIAIVSLLRRRSLGSRNIPNGGGILRDGPKERLRRRLSNSALAATDKIYVYILRFKCGKTQVMVSIKSVQFVTNSKGINIDRSKSALAATDNMCIFFNIPSVDSTLRTVRPLNDPYGSNELNKPLTDRYNAGVLDNPQNHTLSIALS